MCFDNKNHASLAEWSNATDLSSVSFGSAGSNPAGCILGFLTANNKLSKKVGIRFDSGIGVTQLAQSVEQLSRNTMKSDNNKRGPIAQMDRARCL